LEHCRLRQLAALLWPGVIALAVELRPSTLGLEAAFPLLLYSVIVAAVGFYARSFVASLAAAAALMYLTPLPPAWSALFVLPSAVIVFAFAIIRGLYDSVLEYISFPGPYRLSPVLASASAVSAVAYAYPDFAFHHYFLPSAALTAAIASRQDHPVKALLLALAAATGHLGAAAAALYASAAPLPPLSCGRDIVGGLKAFEAETSPARGVAYVPERRWRARVLACSQPGPAAVDLGGAFTVWVYLEEGGLELAGRLARRYSSEVLVLDFDSPGPSTVEEVVDYASSGADMLGLASLPRDALERAVAQLAPAWPGVLVAKACSGLPDDVLLRLLDAPRLIIVTCTLQTDRLFPRQGRGKNLALIGYLSDTASLTALVERLLPGWSQAAVRLVEDGYLLAAPYCGPRIALVDPREGHL